MKKKMVAFIILIVMFAVLYFSLFIVDEREIAIITQFGRVVKIINEPGLHVKLPGFLETIHRFDKRTDILDTKPIQLLLKDKNPLILSCYVCYRISEPLTFFQSLMDQSIAAQRLSDMITSVLGNTLGEYNIDNIINVDGGKVKISEIESKVLADCNQKTKDKYGMEVVSFGIYMINYPTIVLDSIYSRMQAEREKEAQKYRAEGLQEYTKIQAAADREASRISSEAYKKAEILKGNGDKKAMEIYAKAYSKDPQFFEFLKSMDTYKEILGEKTTLILSTHSDLLKYLNNKEDKR